MLTSEHRRLGASVEDMEADVARTRRALEAAEGGLKELRGLFKVRRGEQKIHFEELVC